MAIDLTKLGPRKSDRGKVQLAAVMKATTPVRNGWLCERLGMGTPASVSQFVRRWLLDPRNRKATTRWVATLSKVNS